MGESLVVAGGSAGAIESLLQLGRSLKAPLRLPVAVVIHLPAERPSRLAGLLERATGMPTVHPTDGTEIEPAHIYVAPPDRHLVVDDGRFYLQRGALRNRSRPSIDHLFQSAARAYGNQLIAILLSGTLDDGTAGMAAVKAAGGTTIVQSPEETAFSGMVESALANVDIDRVLTVAEIAAFLSSESEAAVVESGVSAGEALETLPEEHPVVQIAQDSMMQPSVFTCPDCSGTLFESETAGVHEYECRTGHCYSPETLLSSIGGEVETALSVALRALDERADLARRLAERAETRNQSAPAERYRAREQESSRSHQLLERLMRQVAEGDETFVG